MKERNLKNEFIGFLFFLKKKYNLIKLLQMLQVLNFTTSPCQLTSKIRDTFLFLFCFLELFIQQAILQLVSFRAYNFHQILIQLVHMCIHRI